MKTLIKNIYLESIMLVISLMLFFFAIKTITVIEIAKQPYLTIINILIIVLMSKYVWDYTVYIFQQCNIYSFRRYLDSKEATNALEKRVKTIYNKMVIDDNGEVRFIPSKKHAKRNSKGRFSK